MAYYSLAGKGKLKYSVAPTQISTRAPSLTLVRHAKDTSSPVFPDDEFPGSRRIVATEIVYIRIGDPQFLSIVLQMSNEFTHRTFCVRSEKALTGAHLSNSSSMGQDP